MSTITEILGCYGAIVSTFVVARDSHRARSKLVLEVFEGRHEGMKSYCIFVRVSNKTSRPVKLAWVHLLVYSGFYSFRSRLAFMVRYPKHIRVAGWTHIKLGESDQKDLPTIIDPLDSLDFTIPVVCARSGLGDGEQRVKFEAIDGLGRPIRSKAFVLHGVGNHQFDEVVP